MKEARLSQALQNLYKGDLYELARYKLNLDTVRQAWRKDEIADAIAECSVDDVFVALKRNQIGDILKALDLPSSGRKPERAARLMAHLNELPAEELQAALDALKKASLVALAEELEDPDIKSAWKKAQIVTEVVRYYSLASIMDALPSDASVFG